MIKNVVLKYILKHKGTTMDKKDDDNPLVKTNTDEDNVLQSSNVHIEMSSNVNCGNKDKDKKVPNSTSQNDEEMFLLQVNLLIVP